MDLCGASGARTCGIWCFFFRETVRWSKSESKFENWVDEGVRDEGACEEKGDGLW